MKAKISAHIQALFYASLLYTVYFNPPLQIYNTP